MDSNVSIAHFEPRHDFPVKPGKKISPRNEKWIVFRNLLRVFVGPGGELFRFAEEKNCLWRQIIQERGEGSRRFGGTSFTSPCFIFSIGGSGNSSLRLKVLFQYSQFACRWQGDAQNFFARNLRERIEMAEGFKFVAEEFESHRPRAGERPNVENAAAQGDFTLLCDLGFRFAASRFEPL